MEITKMIQKKEARDRDEACVSEMEKLFAKFNSNLNYRTIPRTSTTIGEI